MCGVSNGRLLLACSGSRKRSAFLAAGHGCMSIEMPADEPSLPNSERLLRLQDIQDDDPITLTEASEIVLRGAVSVATLRAEIRRGNLAVERIGKNLFTTRAYIKQMRARLLVPVGSQDGGIEPVSQKQTN